jgi:hypothetical protein
VPFIAGTVSERRRALAVRRPGACCARHSTRRSRALLTPQVYPVLLLYTSLAWLALLS